MSFALAYLNHQQASKAIDMLAQIRKKDPQLMALAATNLSFLYLLEQDFDKADHYASLAVQADKYNAQALVNKGNCHFRAGREEQARDSYLEAVGVQADCVEAMYNLGYVSKLLGDYDEAVLIYRKLGELVPRAPEVVWELADCWERKGDLGATIDALHRLINIVPADPAVWARIASLWDKEGNEEQAFNCYLESYHHCPSDLDVITWLGAYYRERRLYEQALKFFERAVSIAPKEPRYLLMTASCYRQMDQKQEALDLYEMALRVDPLNRQTLEYLVKLCDEMGLAAKSEYYQRQLRDLVERIRQAEEEDRTRTRAGDPQALKTVTHGFEREEAGEAPALRFDSGAKDRVHMVEAGGRDIWDDVDVDLE